MNALLVCFTRWMLVTFWLFGALQQSESAIVCQDKPNDPTIVVLGETNAELGRKNAVSLEWNRCAGDPGETLFILTFKRQKPGSTVQEQIASRGASEGGFTMIAPFEDKTKYEARASQKLNIFNVQSNEEYVYTLEITYQKGGAYLEEALQVTVDVKVPPEIPVNFAPRREVVLSVSSSSVQNYTLTCNASGDPHPNITWTKSGVPASQFNASGYLLHLVDVQREDAGSYICTASNGFGNDTTAIGIVNIQCTDNCQTERVGIRIRDLVFKDSFDNHESDDFKNLESSLLSAIWGVYANNLEKQLHRAAVEDFSEGSVYAIVQLVFGPSVTDPLKPLRDEMNDEKLGPYTVDRQLVENPTTAPATESTETTTGDNTESPSAGARGAGLSDSALWGIIGGCIAFVVVVVIIIILVCCICKKKPTNKGATKGGKLYSEADGYRMNRQPPPSSGLGTASPAYVEARQYAPVTASRRQDDQSKPPQNYADLSFNNSSGPVKQPPPYTRTEYSEMMPEKRQPPAEGQQGESGGFELWC